MAVNAVHTLRASTLFETLMALVIIVTCFGVGTMIYGNVMDSDSTVRSFNARQLMQQWAVQTHVNGTYFDETRQHAPFMLRKKINNNIMILQATLEGEVVATRKELIP